MEGGPLSHTPAISSGVDLRLDLGFKTKGLSLLDDRFAYTARENERIARVSDGGNDMIVQLVTAMPC